MFKLFSCPLTWLLCLSCLGAVALVALICAILEFTFYDSKKHKQRAFVLLMTCLVALGGIWMFNKYTSSKIEEIPDATLQATITGKYFDQNSSNLMLEDDSNEQYIVPMRFIEDADAYEAKDKVKLTIPQVKFEGKTYLDTNKKITMELIK